MSGIVSIAWLPVLFVALSLLSLPGASASRAGPLAQSANGAVQLAETNIVCGRRGCRPLREGCRYMRGPSWRFSRVVCNQAKRG
jgi:hypothetical protein